MNRNDLQKLARIRIKEAKVLLDNGCFEGAYYLAGYAVECALKACIAKKTMRHHFPDKQLVNQAHTHDLQTLVVVAGLKKAREKRKTSCPQFELNWGVVKDWSEQTRYNSPVSGSVARDFYSAIVSRRDGVLTRANASNSPVSVPGSN